MSDETHLDMLEQMARRPAELVDAGHNPDGSPIRVAYWINFPEVGMLTAFTVGVSGDSRWAGDIAPELLISVQSTDLAWAHAIGAIAARDDEESTFDVDETVDFGAPVSTESEMSGFLLTRQMMMPGEFDLLETERGPVALRQMVPLYAEELAIIREMGPALFIAARPDPNSVTRPSVFDRG